MAIMTEQQRTETMRTWVNKEFVEKQMLANLDTVEIKAAVDTTDTWIDNNEASFNTALPEPFKSTATAEQKTLMFDYVAMKRSGLI